MEQELESFELREEEKPYNIRHRCYYFSKEIILFVKRCKYHQVYGSLFDQLIRSATSIGANIVEGKAGSSKKDWKNFFVIALKSANETKYWLCLIRDTMETEITKIAELLKEAEEISNIIARIILNAENQE
ncbi:MAG TPA: four helix bundle protein [Chitinophagaceae bacterium]|jgi:four helix bundle protein|nr:four helix bundle protein [Chitinophagaceae bacterium]